MGQPVGKRRIEYHRHPIAGDDLPVGDRMPCRRLHPGVERKDPECRERRAYRHHDCGKNVHAGRHAFHAEQHHAEEGGLEEEREQDFVREQRSGDIADLVHVAGPVGAELKGHRQAGHNAHRKAQRENLYPDLVDLQPVRLAAAIVAHAEINQEPGQRNGERREQDVKSDVQPELGACQQQWIRSIDVSGPSAFDPF